MCLLSAEAQGKHLGYNTYHNDFAHKTVYHNNDPWINFLSISLFYHTPYYYSFVLGKNQDYRSTFIET